jgi:hypothetical protein
MALYKVEKRRAKIFLYVEPAYIFFFFFFRSKVTVTVPPVPNERYLKKLATAL